MGMTTLPGNGTFPGSQPPVVGNSKTSFLNPGLLTALMKMFSGVMGQTAGGYADFINNPTASPAYQNSLSGLLAALRPQETASRNVLTDQFRAAGGLRGSSYGQSASNLEGNIMRNQQVTASDLLAKMFPEIANALYAPTHDLAGLISGAKGTESTQYAPPPMTTTTSPAVVGNYNGQVLSSPPKTVTQSYGGWF